MQALGRRTSALGSTPARDLGHPSAVRGRGGSVLSAPLVEGAARGLSRSWVVEYPSWGHNPFSSDLPGSTEECSREIRASWIDAPTAPPDTSCIADVKPIEFEIE